MTFSYNISSVSIYHSYQSFSGGTKRGTGMIVVRLFCATKKKVVNNSKVPEWFLFSQI